MAFRSHSRLSGLLATVTALLVGPGALFSQQQPDADRFYLYLAFDADRRPVLCDPVDSALGVPRVYGVDFDSAHRVTEIRRYFFGNLDSRSEWTIMKFEYDTLASGSRLVQRTWYNAGGLPVPLDRAFGENALYRNGRLVMTTLLDSERKRLERVNAVTRMIFLDGSEGRRVQQWRFSNNKQYYGSEPDRWNSQFASLDDSAWFRTFLLDDSGYVVEEYPLSLLKKPVSYPGGELVRRYERNACGQMTRVRFFNHDDEPMVDSGGVHSIAFQYDKSGRLVEWNAFDRQGRPAGRLGYEGAARMTRSYRDFDGALQDEQFFTPAELNSDDS